MWKLCESNGLQQLSSSGSFLKPSQTCLITWCSTRTWKASEFLIWPSWKKFTSRAPMWDDLTANPSETYQGSDGCAFIRTKLKKSMTMPWRILAASTILASSTTTFEKLIQAPLDLLLTWTHWTWKGTAWHPLVMTCSQTIESSERFTWNLIRSAPFHQHFLETYDQASLISTWREMNAPAWRSSWELISIGHF